MATLSKQQIVVWQWNCRGYRRKRASLQQYAAMSTHPPDIILLQEPNCSPSLSGFTTFTGTSPLVGALVSKHLTCNSHTINIDIPHQILEIITQGKNSCSLFILNVYSSPRSRTHSFHRLLIEFGRLGRTLLVCGDFNAPHTVWGYRKSEAKGTRLWDDICNLRYTLHTDPGHPTRLGNSVTRDTCPDLTFSKNTGPVIAHGPLDEHLGSDHYIVATTLPLQSAHCPERKVRITDWTRFRERRQNPPEGLGYEQWLESLSADLDACTRTLVTTTATPDVDPHLLHLWEARRGLTRRWKRQRLNRKLRRRIAQISQEAQEYAETLVRNNWRGFCERLSGTLGTAKTWSILRALIDPSTTRTQTFHRLHSLIHKYRDDPAALLKELEKRFIPTGTPPQYPNYPHAEQSNEELDADITIEEVRVVLQDLRRNTAPGADRIRFSTLRNLSDSDLHHLTNLFNDHWRKGTLPQAWRHADISLIPKPGKPVAIANLRPISLTSCIGKLMEHVLLRRLQPFLERQSFFSHSQFGFRAHLSTQDVLLQLKEEVIGPPSRAQTRAILALDLKGAFDNVAHDLILRNLAESHCGSRMYNYIRSFLRDRTATIGIGPHRSDTIRLTGRGTPQGSVLSPTLFNIALARLPQQLDQIPDVAHAIYADDITIWTTRGSDGTIQDRLQQAVDIVTAYARQGSLSCAPQKSELVLIRARSITPPPEITVHVDGVPVPQVDRARILGLHVQANGKANYTISLLSRQTEQTLAMIRRVSNRRSGLRERDLLRLVEACVISRITYHLPFHRLTQSEQIRVDTMLRKATKLAHGLPHYTATKRLLALGTHNTLGELLEAQWASQRQRLLLTPTGRHLLSRLGHPVLHNYDEDIAITIPTWVRTALKVHPLPRNMHPEHDAGRRRARVRYLVRMLGDIPETNTLYTDAARCHNGYSAVVLDGAETFITAASLRNSTPGHGEVLGVALAVRHALQIPGEVYILTDSQQACRAFLTGRGFSKAALHILHQSPNTDTSAPQRIHLIWTPGHASLPGNDRAHAVAREITLRAARHDEDRSPDQAGSPLTYRDVLKYYTRARHTMGPPPLSFSREEEVALRQLQTNTFPNLLSLHKFYPDRYADSCPGCRSSPTAFHVTVECTAKLFPPLPVILHPFRTKELWEDALRDGPPEVRRALVQRARAVAEIVLGTPD